MAEALGVAASGIAVAQVAVQVGKSIYKLRRLWEDFKDVPSSIGDLLDQIDCLDPALWEAENTFTQTSLPPMFWDSNLGSRSIAYCRKALSSLTGLVDELTLQLNQSGKLRSKIASVKVVLKKEQLRSLERRLHNAITIALTRLQPDIILQKIKESQSLLITQTLQDNTQQVRYQQQIPCQTISLANNEQFEEHALPPRRYSERRETNPYTIRFRLPTWMCRATWELQSFRSYGNWQFNLRYYQTIPRGSDVFRVAIEGTPKDLQMLFASGQASPYDRESDNGMTLLHQAVRGLNKPMIKYLLDIGLSPVEVDYYGGAPIAEIYIALMGEDLISSLEDWSFTNELNKLLDALDVDIDSENKECNCFFGLISKGFLKRLQCLECPQHESTTLQSRLQSLKGLYCFEIRPTVIPDLLQPYWAQDLRALCIESLTSFPLIDLVAYGLGETDADSLSAEWASLAETIISNTPDIHHVEACHDHTWFILRKWEPILLTPLMLVIQSSIYYTKHRDASTRRCTSRVALWLSKVQSSGYDLREYGRRENEMLIDKKLQLNNECEFIKWNCKTQSLKRTVGRIRGYQYGPEPKDWKVLWSLPEKGYAADFWRLVEDGPQLVPGAWVDDSDDEEDDDSF